MCIWVEVRRRLASVDLVAVKRLLAAFVVWAVGMKGVGMKGYPPRKEALTGFSTTVIRLVGLCLLPNGLWGGVELYPRLLYAERLFGSPKILSSLGT